MASPTQSHASQVSQASSQSSHDGDTTISPATSTTTAGSTMQSASQSTAANSSVSSGDSAGTGGGGVEHGGVKASSTSTNAVGLPRPEDLQRTTSIDSANAVKERAALEIMEESPNRRFQRVSA